VQEKAMTRPADLRPRPVRLAALLACALVVAGACGSGCARPAPPGGATSSKANQARQQAEKTAMAGAKAAGEFVASLPHARQTTPTSVNTPAAPPAPTPPRVAGSSPVVVVPTVTVVRPAPPPVRAPDEPVIREKVSSEVPYPTDAEADKDALEQVARCLTAKLAELDPPVRYEPSAAEAKKYIRKDSRNVRQLTAEQKEKAGFREDRVYVEYEVVVSAEQVRELRSRERVFFGLKVLAGVAAAALAGFLFLRADEWTKGYLTSWLAVAALALAGGAAATLALV
jgi:hypothetical protein